MWIVDMFKHLKRNNNSKAEVDIQELLRLDDEQLIDRIIFGGVWPKLQCMGYGIISDDEVSEIEWITYSIYEFWESAIAFPESSLRSFLGTPITDTVLKISDGLAQIGALEYKKVFDEFINANNIDLTDLAHFSPYHVNKNCKESGNNYSFEEVDKVLHKLIGLEKCLANYIRENIEQYEVM